VLSLYSLCCGFREAAACADGVAARCVVGRPVAKASSETLRWPFDRAPVLSRCLICAIDTVSMLPEAQVLDAASKAGLSLGGDQDAQWMQQARQQLAGEAGAWPKQCAHVEEDGSWRLS
jgi:hypothetical protein